MEHVGKQTFSKAFEPLIDHMWAHKVRSKGAQMPTVTERARNLHSK